jgi:amino-acid N-acetyltransferase
MSIGDTLVLEPARPEDAAEIGLLLGAAGLPDEDFAEHLAHFIVARKSGAVVGTVGYEPRGKVALLRSLVVTPDIHRAGLGTRLLERLTTTAKNEGVEQFFLLTSTAEDFFVRRGYTRVARDRVPADVARTREFHGLCPVSAICLTKPLQP